MPARQTAQPRFFRDGAAFRRWLEQHAATESELIVGFHKVGSGQPSISWPQSVDEALCFGWIDGVRARIDDATYKIRFTPRKRDSIWSAINIAKYQSLSEAGRMTAAGAAAYSHRSEAKSVVYAYEQEQTATLSPAEEALFERSRTAWDFFERTPLGYKRVMLHWVVTAKRDETRASRLATLIAACAAGERLR